MFQVHLQNPKAAQWQARLARVPKWAWMLFFFGAVLPLAILGIILVISFFFSGALVLAAGIIVVAIIRFFRRLFSHRPDDGRRNVQIVVRSVRVIDP